MIFVENNWKVFLNDGIGSLNQYKTFLKKGENVACQHLLFQQFFQNTSLSGLFINPLPDEKILDWSKLKQIAGNIFKRI